MQSNISYTLNVNVHSSNALKIRPILPMIFADNDIQRTITINKISSSKSKKHFNNKSYKRLECKQCFLPLTPTMTNKSSLTTIDIQSKLGIHTNSLPYMFNQCSYFRIGHFKEY